MAEAASTGGGAAGVTGAAATGMVEAKRIPAPLRIIFVFKS